MTCWALCHNGIRNKRPPAATNEKALKTLIHKSDASTGTEATVFYRIKARGTDGQTFLSKVITIQTDFAEGALDIGPVPAIGHVTLRWPSTGINKLQVTVFDVTGHAVLGRQYQLKTGLNELRLTDLQSLPNGVYFVKASDGAHYRNGKLVIHN